MQITYTIITDATTRLALYDRMAEEGLLGVAMSAVRPSMDMWLSLTAPREDNVLLAACAPDGGIMGVALFSKKDYRMWSFDFTAFRGFFGIAAAMARGGFAYLFQHYPCACIFGVTPKAHRHAWGLAEACGMHVVGALPGACFSYRKQCNVDGVLVVCTPETLAKKMEDTRMGFGGGGGSSAPVVTPAPKAEVTKPVTEAATNARQNQKDKAKKAAGMSGSILTSDFAPQGGQTQANKTLLGQ